MYPVCFLPFAHFSLFSSLPALVSSVKAEYQIGNKNLLSFSSLWRGIALNQILFPRVSLGYDVFVRVVFS